MQHDGNLTARWPSFVTHLECSMTGERHEADQVHGLSRAGKPLLVRYDLAGVRGALSKEKIAQRAPDLWRYRELLPVRTDLGFIVAPGTVGWLIGASGFSTGTAVIAVVLVAAIALSICYLRSPRPA